MDTQMDSRGTLPGVHQACVGRQLGLLQEHPRVCGDDLAGPAGDPVDSVAFSRDGKTIVRRNRSGQFQNAPGIFERRGGHTVQPAVISSSIS